MPKKKNFRKKSVDKKQTKRIKQLEKFVYKTVENKQVNKMSGNINIGWNWNTQSAFLQVDVGAEDGAAQGDPARIGNSITLMSQKFNWNFKFRNGHDEFNQMRLIVAEALEGSTTLSIANILAYPNYSVHGDMVFNSPYTTKTQTNQRYKIHMDKKFTLTDINPCKVISHVIKYREGGSPGKVVTFDDPTYPNPTNHNITVFAISDSGAVQHPQMDYSVRSTYKDA